MPSNNTDQPASSQVNIQNDPAIKDFESALSHFQAGKWKQAAKDLAGVLEKTESMRIRASARQYAAICERQIAPEPKIDDPYLAAVVAKNRGHHDEALGLCKKAAADDERFVYLQASIHALLGDHESALAQLADAIRLEPKNRVHAYHDPDFEDLRQDEAFAELLANP